MGLLKLLCIGKCFPSGNLNLISNNPTQWVCFAFAISNTFLFKFDTITKCCNTIFTLLSCHSPKISQKCSNSLHYKLHLSPTGRLPCGGNSSVTIWMGWLHHAPVQNTEDANIEGQMSHKSPLFTILFVPHLPATLTWSTRIVPLLTNILFLSF